MAAKLVIGCDHAGFEMKEMIKKKFENKGYKFKDFGTYTLDSVDYPDIIHPLASSIDSGEYEIGIIICGSGNGVSMTANKYPDVRAALCWIDEIARMARLHNNANLIALPARYISEEEAVNCVETFLTTGFEGGRHKRRVNKIAIEKSDKECLK